MSDTHGSRQVSGHEADLVPVQKQGDKHLEFHQGVPPTGKRPHSFYVFSKEQNLIFSEVFINKPYF
mgnify:CR=1 FL=1